MTNGDWIVTGYRRPGCSYRRGDVVRVKEGALTGATGVVDRLADGQRCIIVLDGTDPGVRVILSAAALEIADPLAG